MYWTSAVVISLFACQGCVPNTPQPSQEVTPVSSETVKEEASVAVSVPLQWYQDALLSLQIGVPNGKTETFLFDTAAGVTALDSGLAEALGAEPWGRVTGFRMSGERVDMARCDPVPLHIGDVQLDLAELAIFDLSTLLPPDWPKLGGVLALDALQHRPFTLDLGAAELILETPQSLQQRTRDLTPLQIRLSRPAQGAALDLFIAVKAKRGTVWLEVDTGNTGPVLLAPHAAKQLGLDESATRTDLDLGEWGSLDVDVEVRELILDGNIGQLALKGRRLTVDLEHQAAWLH